MVVYMTTDVNGALPLFCNAYCTALLANLHQNKFGRLSRRSRQSKKRMGVGVAWEDGGIPGRGKGGEA